MQLYIFLEKDESIRIKYTAPIANQRLTTS